MSVLTCIITAPLDILSDLTVSGDRSGCWYVGRGGDGSEFPVFEDLLPELWVAGFDEFVGAGDGERDYYGVSFVFQGVEVWLVHEGQDLNSLNGDNHRSDWVVVCGV